MRSFLTPFRVETIYFIMLRGIWRFVKGCFILFCIVGAVFMTVYLVYQYTLDNDVSSINFNHFHDAIQNVYPSISLCFGNRMGGSFFNDLTNSSAYINFLSGCDNDDLRGDCNKGSYGIRYEDFII